MSNQGDYENQFYQAFNPDDVSKWLESSPAEFINELVYALSDKLSILRVQAQVFETLFSLENPSENIVGREEKHRERAAQMLKEIEDIYRVIRTAGVYTGKLRGE